ncbi:Myosin light chain kinase-related [Plasmopara halstedii]|uniref:Myosin light chain kinase-related n=1 Tax=Plasmopara halstedii TaxID=4781 RepID=A0A0N7L6T6_PLAHL|nr:Myosin light chain kinase-related [Plasmopara halstedii]CEG45179.1 Myosin light chain kinase-related [Plasmopara halstedii]|eukprot:XP_024581548.1 Myosin light chain kinase-related [Plasmopara halstedii]
MVLATATIVRAHLHKVSELLHVWEAVEQYLDYSGGWTLERAAAHGMQYLVQHLASKKLHEHATLLIMDFAACNGHLNILAWLHDTLDLSGCSTRAMDNAAKNGHLRVVAWLHTNRSEGCTTKAMDYAAGSGHLSVVQWLHCNRSEGCTSRAMDLAAQNGHLDILQWLNDNRREGCTSSAVSYAANNGHLKIVIWLCEVRKEDYTSRTVVNAARGGHLCILKYLRKHCIDKFESAGHQMVHAAITNGQVWVLTWLVAVLPSDSLKLEEAPGSWMDLASEFGQIGILQWFHAQSNALPASFDGQYSVCTVEAIEKAARYGHNDVLDYLYENDLVNLTVEPDAMKALVAAIKGGHFECVKWLVSHFRDLYKKSSLLSYLAMDAAAAAGKVDILQYLRDDPTTCEWRFSLKAVNEASRQGFVDVLRWLHHDNFKKQNPDDDHYSVEFGSIWISSNWTPTALELAAANGHLPAVQWLMEHHPETCYNFEAFNAAAYMDHLEVVKYLYNYVQRLCSMEQALEHAAEGGAEETLAWLQSRPNEEI